MSDKSRVEWIDAARGIGIFLVVFGHVWRGLASAGIIPISQLFIAVDNAIYLFHMPLFFVLSGMFFERSALNDNFAESLQKRSVTLIYPLVLWSYITAAFLLAAGSLTNRSQISLFDALTYPIPPKDIYWFLAALFIVQTLAWFAVRARTPIAYVIAFCVSAVLVYALDLTTLSVWVRNTVENAPLFFLGLLLSRVPFQSRVLAAFGLMSFAAAEIWAVTWPDLLRAPLDFLPGLVATIGIVLGAASAWPARVKVLGFIPALGKASMTIYVSHIIALAAARIALVKLGVTNPAVHILIGVSAGIVLPMAFHLIATRLGLMRLFGLGRDNSPFYFNRSARFPPTA